MSDLASHTPADPALVADLAAGIAEARAIYELLFPTQQLFSRAAVRLSILARQSTSMLATALQCGSL